MNLLAALGGSPSDSQKRVSVVHASGFAPSTSLYACFGPTPSVNAPTEHPQRELCASRHRVQIVVADQKRFHYPERDRLHLKPVERRPRTRTGPCPPEGDRAGFHTHGAHGCSLTTESMSLLRPLCSSVHPARHILAVIAAVVAGVFTIERTRRRVHGEAGSYETPSVGEPRLSATAQWCAGGRAEMADSEERAFSVRAGRDTASRSP